MEAYRSLPACDDYFPSGMLPTQHPDKYDIKSAWYSVPLAALGEPCLHNYDSGEAQVYRFLWLPSFDPDVVVTFYSEDRYCRAWGNTIEWAMETFIPLKPKNVSVGKGIAVDLSTEQCNELRHLLMQADFWNLPVTIEHDFGNDGAQFIIQAVRGQHYQLTDRWDPPQEYRAVFEYVLKTSGFYNDRFERY